MSRILNSVGVLLIGVTQCASLAMAQEFREKQPLKIVVAVPAGGLTDTLARITADFLQRRLGKAVVVENTPGAAKSVPEANPLIGEEFKKRVLEEQLNWKGVADREKIVAQQ